MNKFFVILLLLATLMSCSDNNLTFNGSDITKADLDSNFELISHTGEKKNLDDFKGKVIAIFFGFANCPDICPTTMFELKKIKSELGKNSKELVVLFVCFRTKTSYWLSLFEMDKRPTVAYARRHTNCTSGLQCLFLIPPDNVVLCYVAKLLATAEI